MQKNETREQDQATGTVEAEFRHYKLADGKPGKSVVLELTGDALTIHFDGSKWQQHTGLVPVRESLDIFFTTMVDGYTVLDNHTIQLKPVHYLKDWRGTFIIRDGSGFAGKFAHLAREGSQRMMEKLK